MRYGIRTDITPNKPRRLLLSAAEPLSHLHWVTAQELARIHDAFPRRLDLLDSHALAAGGDDNRVSVDAHNASRLGVRRLIVHGHSFQNEANGVLGALPL